MSFFARWIHKTASVACFLIVIPTLVSADVIIELTNGKRIVVNVEKDDIRNISFTESRAGEASGPVSSPPADSGIEAKRVTDSQSRIWQVGPTREFKYPSDVARKAKDGDTIEIDAGSYHNDYATWSQSNLTIRGVNGMAHLKSKGLIKNGKAIWVVRGDNVSIENMEFSGAAVRDKNGAGIRHAGGNLTLTSTFFHDNEFSMLTGQRPDATILISSSRFWHQKRKNTFSHGIYIGAIGRFKITGSHFKGTQKGHHIKSRALENHILYNRIEDPDDGNASRLIDLPNCGLSYVIGNDLHQAASSENFNAIGYGAEGCDRRNEDQLKLFVVSNTFVNEARSGPFVKNFIDGEVLVANNLVFGKGDFLAGDGFESNNVRESLADRQSLGWNAPPGSVAIDNAKDMSNAGNAWLFPVQEFSPPLGSRSRPVNGQLDIGSREQTPRS